MTSEKIAEKIPSWLKQVLIPELNEIKGEIKAVSNRIDALDDKMDTRITALESKMDTKIDSLRKEMLSKFEGLGYRFETINIKLDSLDKRIPMIEKMAAL